MATSSSGYIFLARYPKAQSLLPSDHLELFAQCIILLQLDHVSLITQCVILSGLILLSLFMKYVRTRRRKISSIKFLIDQDIRRQTFRSVKRRRVVRSADDPSNTQNQSSSNPENHDASTRPLDITHDTQNQNNGNSLRRNFGTTTLDALWNTSKRNTNNTIRRNRVPTSLKITRNIPDQEASNTRNLYLSESLLEDTCNTHNYNAIESQVQGTLPRYLSSDLPSLSSNNNNSNLQSSLGESLPLLGSAQHRTSQKHLDLRMAWRAAFFQTALYVRWYLRLFAKKTRLLGCKIHAWTMQQPDKLPILGSELPPNIVSLAIIFMVLLNLGLLFIGLSLDHSFFPNLAERAGILYTTNIPALYFLSMKTQPSQRLTYCSYVHLNIFHRRLGDLMSFFVLVHASVYIGPMIIDAFSQVYFADLFFYATYRKVIYHDPGSVTPKQVKIMSGLFLLLVFSVLRHSTFWRRRNYRRFISLHIVSQFITQFGLFVHAPSSRIYVCVGLGLWVVDRFVFRYLAQNKRLLANIKILQDERIVRLSITDNEPKSILQKVKRFMARCLLVSWVPGTFVFLKVKTLPAPYNNHIVPFFVMSANERPEKWFTFYDIQMVVKDTGGWSHALLEEAIQRSPWFSIEGVELEGPYGTTWPQEMLRDRDICILVATPNGITLLLALARSLIDWERGSTFGDDNLTTPPRPKVVIMMHGHPWDLIWCQEELRILQDRHEMEYISFRPTDNAKLVGEEISSRIRDIDTTMDKRTGVICFGPRELQRAVRGAVSQSRSAGYKCLVDTLSYDH